MKTYTSKNTDEKCQKVTYTEAIPMTDHNWGTTEENGTGANDGQQVYKCQTPDCGAEKPVSHTCPTEFTEANTTVTTTASTCAVKGSKITRCKVCNDILDTEELALSETHGDKTTLAAVAATCTKTGLTAGERCNVCGKVTKPQETVAVKPDAHTADTSKWMNDATNHWRVCKDCKKVVDDTKNPHGFANVPDSDPAKEKCNDCGFERNKVTEPEHTCTADTSSWVVGTNGHYHNCATANCAVQAGKDEAQKLDYAAHASQGNWVAEGDDMVKKCVCGKVMETCQHPNVENGTCADCQKTGLTDTNPSTPGGGDSK